MTQLSLYEIQNSNYQYIYKSTFYYFHNHSFLFSLSDIKIACFSISAGMNKMYFVSTQIDLKHAVVVCLNMHQLEHEFTSRYKRNAVHRNDCNKCYEMRTQASDLAMAVLLKRRTICSHVVIKI